MISKLTQLLILTTIFSILISTIISQTTLNTIPTPCNSEKPFDFNECFLRQVSNAYSKCCYLENYLDQNKKICLEIPATSFTGSNLYSLNNILYRINCPNVSDKDLLRSCAPIVPTGRSDCSNYSTLSESCCFNVSDKTCNWLGTKYRGNVLWAGKNLDCAAGFLKENLVKIIMLALFVLFL